MGSYTLSRRALASVQGQFGSISAPNASAAQAVKSEIHRACEVISDFPEMGRKIEATDLR